MISNKMFAPVLAALILSVALGGCVSTGTYELKEKEVLSREKSLQELQQKYADLLQVNSELNGRLKQSAEDLAAIAKERDRYVAANSGLQESLKSSADEKNKKIAELTLKISDLEKENAMLVNESITLRKAKEEEVQKTSRTYEEMLEKMKKEISHGEIVISELKGKLTVNMLNAILFDSGEAEVKPAGLKVLNKLVDILRNARDKTIRVEGHTDANPINGELARKFPTNWELSAARAINVTRYLQQQGVDPASLAAVAYGEYRPVASNDTEEGQARNRRTEIVLVPKE
jgi:chemotaxis protein MotB